MYKQNMQTACRNELLNIKKLSLYRLGQALRAPGG
jgi:hypothetical protein